MKAAVFSTKTYDREFLELANNAHQHELVFLEPRLTRDTAALAEGFPAVCLFVNDQADQVAIQKLAEAGTRFISLRSAGFNNVDLKAAGRFGVKVARVPAYSPYAVAEHTVGLLLTLNRKINRAYARVREGNFALDGLLGFDIHGKTVGIVGTGKIGEVVARIMYGFGCDLLAYDPVTNPQCEKLGVRYVSPSDLFANSDIITLHCPLMPATHHIIDAEAIARMKSGVVLLNTSRGALIDTQAVIEGLKSGKIGYLGLDVYEEEADLFFEDLSNQVIQDDVFARLLTFPNVVITGHQAYFTRNALEKIADTTLSNITEFEQTNSCANEVQIEDIKR
ncbi:2-hydroxyacid dehydrogenase [candidate division KSB1 bacterium]|nr:2-hydroxyacid dehydrogenase [candidate division KSB1 bacterium]NIR71260.1 2-hydroxyacid dehydrogenase [candidate division KSB1 bacterium]NIS24789.1 2-hydroxyacid dehydrogenase [candidate division KSB1 bacterium]NIT71696.1 2-hydroxyacid dehydrogenase [candidate division KSB1 bacterium]NIU25425.1 2-hydroxyacid dehydrogenase [candidate division KSB1 bacterium]